MKKLTVACSTCHTIKHVSRKTLKLWVEDYRRPYVCNDCIAARIKKAVADSQDAKADSSQRAFLSIQKQLSKPTLPYALPRNRPRQQAT